MNKKKKKQRISVSSAKAKARRLQNWAAEKISGLLGLPWGYDEMIAPREMGQSGVDVRLVGEALDRFPWSVECKNQETWSVHSWIEQAQKNVIPDTQWLLICARNNKKPVVILDGEVFFQLLSLKRGKKGL